MRLTGLLAVAACAIAARTARADDRFEVGAGVVAEGAQASWGADGPVGGEGEMTRWFGRLGVALEAGEHSIDGNGSARWLGAAVRLGQTWLGRGRNEGYGGARIWLEVGIAAKRWSQDVQAPWGWMDATYVGPRAHLGAGVDLLGRAHAHGFGGGLSMWLRVERGPTPDYTAAPETSLADELEPVPAWNVVLGNTLFFDGPI